MKSSCRLQSELGPALWDWLRLAAWQPIVPAIVACVSPRASEGHADLTSSPPSSQPFVRSEQDKFQTLQSDKIPNVWHFVLLCIWIFPFALRAKGWAVPSDTCNTRQGLRSFPNLMEHLTARADDNHAAPVLHPRRSLPFGRFAVGFQALVRFLAY